MLVDIIILYPDNLITFSLKKNFTPAIIRDLPILRMRRTIDLDDEPCFRPRSWFAALLPPVCRRREANERDGSVGVA